MSRPPSDRNESTVVETSRSLPTPTPTPFLSKTYQLVDDKSFDHIISWNKDGSSFIVWDHTQFARDLLPKYFKHNNFSSFVRQLNTYGFRKVVPDRWEFSNDCFRKSDKKLLCDIQRRKITTPPPLAAVPPPRVVSPSNSGEQTISSSYSPSTDLLDENERLKIENVKLKKELAQMKSLCSNIYSLMSNYSATGKTNNNNNEQCSESSGLVEKQALDLLPMKRFCDELKIVGEAEEINARLFGVAIGLKRVRQGDEECSGAGEVVGDKKSEPLSSGDDHGSTCLKRG